MLLRGVVVVVVLEEEGNLDQVVCDGDGSEGCMEQRFMRLLELCLGLHVERWDYVHFVL